MPDASSDIPSVEREIDRWRGFVSRREAIGSVDVAELEDHLREQIAMLTAGGLAPDEAFLIAVKRIGSLDALSLEFAREHSERLWKQLVAPPPAAGDRDVARTDALMAFGFAAASALAIKLPALFGMPLDDPYADFYFRNASFFTLPFLTAYFVWKRRLPWATTRWLALGFLAAAVVINSFPFATRVTGTTTQPGNTELLAALHLPIALWLAVGIAYAGGRWSQSAARMDFVRFSGELFIYFVLIGLGGGLLMGFTGLIFSAIGLVIEPVFEQWLLPCGAMGGVVVAAWLVEAKQSVIENMAPVLTKLFTPLFALVLLAFLGAMLLTGRGVNVERELLISFDLLLALVLGLLLYSISARDPSRAPGPFDVVQLVLVLAALLADGLALSAIATRISAFGWTPNRVAALGENLILLVNLGWSAVLSQRFLRGRGAFHDLERWQTACLPVYAGWAAVVVVIFPPIFRFI